ncbi:glycosyltransferase family 2 protein [bacterium]|nr:glycosyltransferase family 2 protein [bacterium]
MIETPPVTSRACVMIPTYNHFKFLPAVIEKVRQQGLPVIVVDDGSTDSSQSFLSGLTDIEVITFSKNRGKGSALAAGLRRAGKRGYALAVCIDADGQHDPKDIPRMIAAAKNRLDTLVIGAREYGQETAPRKSRFGRVFSNFWIWIETGKNMADTQSGFRLYPVAAMNQLKIRASRYGWEVEALARAVWGGLQVISIPVAVSYAAKKDSHFRVGRDFFLVSCTNAYLVLRRLMPFGFRKVVTQEKVVWPKSWKEKSRFLWQHYLWQTDQTPGEKALAIGIGVFGAGRHYSRFTLPNVSI